MKVHSILYSQSESLTPSSIIETANRYNTSKYIAKKKKKIKRKIYTIKLLNLQHQIHHYEQHI